MQKSKNAFTMIELVFVIVVLGILAAVAIPRLAATRTDAEITKGRADIASIRSAIVTERQARLITGDSLFIEGTDMDTAAGLFDGVLTYPLAAATANGRWNTAGGNDINTSNYTYRINGGDTAFQYTRDNGVFTCIRNTDDCNVLTD